MASKYSATLISAVIENSTNRSSWQTAVTEWQITDCIEDESCSSQCVCGKEEIKYLFEITNETNGNILFPIGSECIKKFKRVDLNEAVSIQESMFKLLHAVDKNEFISLKGGLFSRKILHYLYNRGVFRDNEYNYYNGYNDYEYMIKMFNKRDISKVSENQDKKVKAIILNHIKPYLKRVLAGKIKSS